MTVGGWILFALSAGVLFRILAKFGFGRASLDDVSKIDRNGKSGGVK